MKNTIAVSIVWILDEESACWKPVYVTDDDWDAEEYMYERMEDYNFTYVSTRTEVSSPKLFKREVLSDVN